MKKLELVQYPHEDQPHNFEAHVSTDDIQAEHERRHGPVTVGRIKIFDEETGKFAWFVIGAMLNGNKQPVIEVCHIRENRDKITATSGKWRTPEPEDLARAENVAL